MVSGSSALSLRSRRGGGFGSLLRISFRYTHRVTPFTATGRSARGTLAGSCILGLSLTLLATPVAAESPVGAVFLRVGVGARSAGLADADIVTAADASLLHTNPAGLGHLERREILLLHNEWLADVRQEFIGGVFPIGRGGLGLAANGFYVGNIPRYVDEVPTAEAQGDFGAYDLAIMAGYGHPLAAGLTGGAVVKGIFQHIDIESASSFALDVGARYETPIEGLALAAVVTNIGPSIDFGGSPADLPLEGRAGAGYRHAIGPFDAGIYALYHASRQLNPRVHAGAEIGAHGIYLRAGGKTGYDAEDVAFGLGCEHGRFAVDYAFVPFSEDLLGEAHRVSLAFSP
jgi:hypothetical protein